MKPNQEQQEFIKEKLLGMLKSRETYEELYDHILSALEAMPDDVMFSDAIHQIIEQDLGGQRTIKLIEAKYMKIAIREFITDYFKCLGQCLTSYLMLIVIAVTVMYYLLMQYEWFRDFPGQVMPNFINLIPAAIITANKLNAQKKKGWKALRVDYAKSNIKPFGNIFMLFFPIMLWELMSIGCMFLQNIKLLTRQIGYYGLPINVATAVFFIILVHAVTYYKLYKDWGKAIMAS